MIKRLAGFLKEDWHCYIHTTEKSPSRIKWLWSLFWFETYGRVAWIVCHFRGHKWDSHFSCGPDSASEYHQCTRCGENWHHIYY